MKSSRRPIFGPLIWMGGIVFIFQKIGGLQCETPPPAAWRTLPLRLWLWNTMIQFHLLDLISKHIRGLPAFRNGLRSGDMTRVRSLCGIRYLLEIIPLEARVSIKLPHSQNPCLYSPPTNDDFFQWGKPTTYCVVALHPDYISHTNSSGIVCFMSASKFASFPSATRLKARRVEVRRKVEQYSHIWPVIFILPAACETDDHATKTQSIWHEEFKLLRSIIKTHKPREYVCHQRSQGKACKQHHTIRKQNTHVGQFIFDGCKERFIPRTWVWSHPHLPPPAAAGNASTPALIRTHLALLPVHGWHCLNTTACCHGNQSWETMGI